MLAAVLLIVAQFAGSAPPAAADAVAQPSAEAVALGEEVARGGVLATLLPLMAGQEAEQIIAANPGLPEAEVERLRRAAAETAQEASDRIFAAEGRAYAAAMSLEDLRAVAAYSRSDAARRARDALPSVIAATMATLEGFDFKAAVRARFCAQTPGECAIRTSD